MAILPANDRRRQLLESGEFTPVFLVTFGFSSPIRVCNADQVDDLVVGGVAYKTKAGFVGAKPLARDDRLGITDVEIVLSDADPKANDSWYRRFFSIVGIPVRVDVVLLYEDNGGYQFTETLSVYRGRLDEVKSGAGQREAYLTVLKFRDFLASRRGDSTFLLTDNNQRRRDATDTSLRYVSANFDLTRRL